MEDLKTQEEKLRAMRQFVESKRLSEWEEQKDWESRRARFRESYNDLIKQGVSKEKLQPYMMQFLEKEAEMQNRDKFIPEEEQKEKQTGDLWV